MAVPLKFLPTSSRYTEPLGNPHLSFKFHTPGYPSYNPINTPVYPLLSLFVNGTFETKNPIPKYPYCVPISSMLNSIFQPLLSP